MSMELKVRGICSGRRLVARLMRENGLNKVLPIKSTVNKV